MKQKSAITILAVVIALLLIRGNIQAQNVTTSNEYSINASTDYPSMLKVGESLDCGKFQIKIIGQPILTKSSNSLIANVDLKFLILRIGILNNSERVEGWLLPGSFKVQETYAGHAYGTYSLDYIMSAKAASGYNLPVFFSDIEPGEMLSTVLVFEVFPEAENWIFTFSPAKFADEISLETVRFLLPNALRQ